MKVFKTFGFSVHFMDDVADKITERVKEGWNFEQIISIHPNGQYATYNVLMSKEV